MSTRVNVTDISDAWEHAWTATGAWDATMYNVGASGWAVDSITGNLELRAKDLAGTVVFEWILPYAEFTVSPLAMYNLLKVTNYCNEQLLSAHGTSALLTAARTRANLLRNMWGGGILQSVSSAPDERVIDAETVSSSFSGRQRIMWTRVYYAIWTSPSGDYTTVGAIKDFCAVLVGTSVTEPTLVEEIPTLWYAFGTGDPLAPAGKLNAIADGLMLMAEREFAVFRGRKPVYQEIAAASVIVPVNDGTLENAIDRVILSAKKLALKRQQVMDAHGIVEINQGSVRG